MKPKYTFSVIKKQVGLTTNYRPAYAFFGEMKTSINKRKFALSMRMTAYPGTIPERPTKAEKDGCRKLLKEHLDISLSKHLVYRNGKWGDK